MTNNAEFFPIIPYFLRWSENTVTGRRLWIFLFVSVMVFGCAMVATSPSRRIYTAAIKLDLPSAAFNSKEKINAAMPEVPRALNSMATGELVWDESQQHARVVFTCTSHSARTATETVSELALQYQKKFSPSFDMDSTDESIRLAKKEVARARAAVDQAREKLNNFQNNQQSTKVVPVSYMDTIEPRYHPVTFSRLTGQITSQPEEKTLPGQAATLPEIQGPGREAIRAEIDRLVKQRSRMLLTFTSAHPAIEIISDDIAQLAEQLDALAKKAPEPNEVFTSTPATIKPQAEQPVAEGAVLGTPSLEEERKLAVEYQNSLQQLAAATTRLEQLRESRYQDVASQITLSKPMVLRARQPLVPWGTPLLGVISVISIACGCIAIRLVPTTPAVTTASQRAVDTERMGLFDRISTTARTPVSPEPPKPIAPSPIQEDQRVLDDLREIEKMLKTPVIGRVPDKGVAKV